VIFLVQVGHTTYWTSSGALIGLAARAEERSRWFAFIHAVRNSGLGIGSALGAFALAAAEVAGLHVIVIANAASFVLAAGLLARWRPPRHDQPATAPDGADGADDPDGTDPDGAEGAGGAGYRRVLRDRRYLILIGVNVTLVFSQMLISILLAIYIVRALHAGAWIAGTLIMLNTVQVALLQTAVSSRVERYRRTRVILAGALLNGMAFSLFALLGVVARGVVPGWAVLAGLFAAMVVFSFGEIIAFPAIDYLSVSMAQERIRGRYLAVFQLSWTVGQVTAPGILIFLLARGAALPMIFLLALSLLAAPLLLLLERPEHRRGNENHRRDLDARIRRVPA